MVVPIIYGSSRGDVPDARSGTPARQRYERPAILGEHRVVYRSARRTPGPRLHPGCDVAYCNGSVVMAGDNRLSVGVRGEAANRTVVDVGDADRFKCNSIPCPELSVGTAGEQSAAI